MLTENKQIILFSKLFIIFCGCEEVLCLKIPWKALWGD